MDIHDDSGVPKVAGSLGNTTMTLSPSSFGPMPEARSRLPLRANAKPLENGVKEP